MSDKHANGLHLSDLSIGHFRGIDHLSIRRLGRVTLLAGRNGVGKTTVLEAVRVHAARGRPTVLHELLNKREEFASGLDEDRDPVVFPDYAALFHGRTASRERPITIGPSSGADDAGSRARAEPRKMGAAIGAGDLDATAPLAVQFIDWVRRLFG